MATFAKSWHRSRKVTLACAVVRVGALMGVEPRLIGMFHMPSV
jgi:hypothetical protein